MELQHPIAPVYDHRSRVLILGSFPSVASRAEGFFYAHPRNRFWPVLAALLEEPLPGSIEEKTGLLLRRGVALWDCAASCEIEGSADATLRCHAPNNLRPILAAAEIQGIFCNGAAAWQIYHREIEPITGRPAARLPSTSPANAAWSQARLEQAWSAILPLLEAQSNETRNGKTGSPALL